MENIFHHEQQAVIAAYSERLRSHGADVRTLNWGSRASQERRFEVIAEAGIRSGMSVLDVGCGLGDLLPWLNARGIEVDYTGLDVTPGMIASCRERFPSRTFHEGDIVSWCQEDATGFDFVVASGIFYDRPGSGQEYMQNAVRAMLRLCRTGVACNTITAMADQPAEDEFRPTIALLGELCASFTPRFILRHDYHPCDATLYLYKNDPS
jgi:ubiquinone/menaquinone biosynthesis C-methylase UbiE